MTKGAREFTRDMAMLPLLAFWPLLGLLSINFVTHLIHSRTAPVRPYFSAVLLLICFSDIRFKSYIHFAITGFILILFNPIWPIHIGSWWLWQIINWMTLLFILGSGFFVSAMADKESKADHHELFGSQ